VNRLPAPRVSVVIPAYNAAEFVSDAVRSVLAQTLEATECIVVDDGSTDGTASVVQGIVDPRIRLIRQENLGVSEARNAGARVAVAGLLAFLDADDVWLPEKLERQLARFEKRADLVMVATGYAITDADLAPLTVIESPRDPGYRRWGLVEGNGALLSSTAMIRRTAFQDVGGFRSSLSTSADLDFGLRVTTRGPVEALGDPLVLYRTHPVQMHSILDAFEREATVVLDEHFHEQASDHRRGLANLHTRLFFYKLRGRRGWARHVWIALRTRPARLAALPAEAMCRRIRRRLRHRRLLRSGWPAEQLAWRHDELPYVPRPGNEDQQ